MYQITTPLFYYKTNNTLKQIEKKRMKGSGRRAMSRVKNLDLKGYLEQLPVQNQGGIRETGPGIQRRKDGLDEEGSGSEDQR